MGESLPNNKGEFTMKKSLDSLEYRKEDLVELTRSSTQSSTVTILTDGRVVVLYDSVTNQSNMMLLKEADSCLTKEQLIRAKQLSTYKNTERIGTYFNANSYNYVVEHTKEKPHISPDDVERLYLLSCELDKFHERVEHLTDCNKDLKLVSASRDFVSELLDPYYVLIREALKAGGR